MGYVDADAHVIENGKTWDYLALTEQEYRPRTAEITEIGSSGGAPARRRWVVGDEYTVRHPDDGQHAQGRGFPIGTTDLSDVARRLEDMDRLGIEIQVLFSTFWLGVEIEHPLAEAALARSYNRWLAERTSESNGRLRWALIAPTGSIDQSIQEIRFWKEHGAAGVHLPGVPRGMALSDPYFWPLYEAAQDEDLPIVIHIGSGLRKQRAHFYDLIPSWNVLSHAVPVITAFNTLLVDDLYKRFPRLRWGFLETGSTWVPFVFQQTSRRGTSGAREDRDWGSPTKIVADRNLFVACEVDEDIEYLAGWVGAERMVVGTDYGHNDMGSDLEAHRILLERPDVHSDLTERIVDANARALYGLEAPTSK